MAALLVAPAAEAAFPGKNGRIAFNREDSIWTMRPDGSDQEKILRQAGAPSYAAGGRVVTFGRNATIWRAWANGASPRKLTNPGCCGLGDRDPAFSRDGSKIAFSADRECTVLLEICGDGPERFGIYVMSADGTHERNLTEPTTAHPRRGGNDDADPTFTPDGERIVFARGGDLWSIRVDGSGERRLTRTPAREAHPDLAPDGGRVVVEVTDANGERPRLMTMRPDGSKRHVVPGTSGAGGPVFSPNGRHIVYSKPQPGLGNGDLFTIRTNGRGERQLTARFPFEGDPSWGVRP
jgi:Tol biopolymer transport system component